MKSLSSISISLFFFCLTTPVTSGGENKSKGEIIYQNYCNDCHEGGFWGWMTGAPNIMEKSEWSTYLEKDTENIIQAAIQGTDGGMNPKGDCDECSDEEIHQAVEYMLSKLKN